MLESVYVPIFIRVSFCSLWNNRITSDVKLDKEWYENILQRLYRENMHILRQNHEIASLYGIPLRILYLMFHTFGYSHVFFSTPRKFCITRTTSTHFCILSHISAMFSRFKWLKNVTYKVICKHTTTVFPLLNKKYVNIFLVNY